MTTPTTWAMPPLLQTAIAAMTEPQARIAQRLWAEEPALRSLVAILHSQHPSHYKQFACPHCGHHGVAWSGLGKIKIGDCSHCRQSFSATVGTPYYRLQSKSYHGLFGTALTLWGPWTPFYAWRIASCSDTKQFADFRRRLLPLLAELPADQPLASAPVYRMGLTPAQQGVRCLRCCSQDLFYRRRLHIDNPTFECRHCRYSFELHASRRALDTPPPQLMDQLAWWRA